MKKTNYISAIYTKSMIDRYNNNPFTEALPNKLLAHDFFSKIETRPSADLLIRDASNEVKIANLRDIFTNFYVAFSQQYFLYSDLFDVLYEGYVERTPQRFLEYIQKTKTWNENTFLKSSEAAFLANISTRGFPIIGPSGAGKSMGIAKVLNFLPHSIKHKQFFQVPFIKLECPLNGSTKELCLDFFMKLDQKLGFSDYHKLYSKPSTTEYTLIQQMANKSVLHWLGVLVIDEVQNLNASTPKAKEKLLNFFKRINNSIAVPIIFIGTHDAREVLEGNYQQARRTQGIGEIEWEKLSKKSPEWKRLLQLLWKLQVLKDKSDLSIEIETCYFKYTQGIIDTLVTLHHAVQKRAIESGTEKITPELIKYVAEKKLRSTTTKILEYQLDGHNTQNDIHDYKSSVKTIETAEKTPIHLNDATHSKKESTSVSIEKTQGAPTTTPITINNPKKLRDSIKDCNKSPISIYDEILKLGYIADNNKDFTL